MREPVSNALAVVLLPVVLVLAACGDDAGTPASTTAVADGASAVRPLCDEAAATLGAADPPNDLDGILAGAEDIAELAAGADTGTALDAALADVADGAALLEAAAADGDHAAIADAAATLTAAYDELDLVAAELRTAPCTSESWGRQVVIAAVELVGAGG